MSFNFVEQVNKLTPEQKLHFYELLAHNLTISIRGVWSDSSINDAEKLEQIKWINEVSHRMTAKIWVLRLNTHEWTEIDIWHLISSTVDQKPNIQGHLTSAITQSYQSIMLSRQT